MEIAAKRVGFFACEDGLEGIEDRLVGEGGDRCRTGEERAIYHIEIGRIVAMQGQHPLDRLRVAHPVGVDDPIQV
jgi:hypothetical protein